MKAEVIYKNGNYDALNNDEKNAVQARLDWINDRFANAESVIVTVDIGDNAIKIDHDVHWPKFERIRRITGYLVGSIDKWNNAKRVEESERVKHVSSFAA